MVSKMAEMVSSMTQLVTSRFSNDCTGFIYDTKITNVFNSGCTGFIYDAAGYQWFQQWLYWFHIYDTVGYQ